MAVDHSNPAFRHGHSGRAGKSRTYRTWRSMMQRCYREREKGYVNYGARGIRVCERWHDFVNFLADMGEAKPGLELDRIDNEKNYEPTNCRWATRLQQQRNTRITTKLEFRGVVKALGDWADEYGISRSALAQRLARGWTVEKAITTPRLTLSEVSALGTATRWAKAR